MDKAEGKQISAANVIVLTVNTVQTLVPSRARS